MTALGGDSLKQSRHTDDRERMTSSLCRPRSGEQEGWAIFFLPQFWLSWKRRALSPPSLSPSPSFLPLLSVRSRDSARIQHALGFFAGLLFNTTVTQALLLVQQNPRKARLVLSGVYNWIHSLTPLHWPHSRKIFFQRLRKSGCNLRNEIARPLSFPTLCQTSSSCTKAVSCKTLKLQIHDTSLAKQDGFSPKHMAECDRTTIIEAFGKLPGTGGHAPGRTLTCMIYCHLPKSQAMKKALQRKASRILNSKQHSMCLHWAI